MLGFSYQTVRGTEFPLWFVIAILVLVVGAAVACFFPFKAYKEDMPQESKEEMSDYMSKDRLMKILFHYIRGRYGEIMYKNIVSVITEYETKDFFIKQQRRTKGAFYTYDRISTPGCNEWIFCCCACVGHNFDVEVCGSKLKRVTITDRYDFEKGNLSSVDIFYTFYDENFNPKANETSLRGNTVKTQGFDIIKPFTDENTTYKGINRDICVCYDIAKNA